MLNSALNAQPEPLVRQQQRFERLLRWQLQQQEADTPERLYKAICYTALSPGKRIRPLLVYGVGQLLNIPLPILDPIALSLELIHCYSLVHDDLPAMDNDTWRRGQITCHLAFDQATAILVGDTLQSLAFQILCTPNNNLPVHQQSKLVYILSKTIGMQGMAAGQQLDLNFRTCPWSQTDIDRLHQLKTGYLIQISLQMPAIVVNTPSDLESSLCQLGRSIGCFFQLQDDIADYPSQYNEPNYCQLLGIDRSYQQLKEIHTTICEQCKQLKLQPNHLLTMLLGQIGCQIT